ncbi:hypothetical protein ABZ470_31615 [Streptosporangium sp. NPDC020072]|uniref:hypothetical protein n=1 Tax=Streptosporangium sp. NPDC020072 TaxID=3154788 RepID=UPI00343D1294
MGLTFTADDLREVCPAIIVQTLWAEIARLAAECEALREDNRRLAGGALMDVPAVARYIGMEDRWVTRDGPTYGLPIFKVGKYYKARRSDLDAWLDALRAGQTAQPVAA